MADGIYSQGRVVDGVMPQAAGEADALDLMVGSPFRIEGKMLPGLDVPGAPGRIRTRLAKVDVFWPSVAIAFDQFPARTDNTQMPGGRTVGEFYVQQSVRRRAVLARLNIAYLFRHAGDEALTPEHVGAAYKFVAEHRDDPAPEPENPLAAVSYEDSMTRNLGVSFDPETGVGARVREE